MWGLHLSRAKSRIGSGRFLLQTIAHEIDVISQHVKHARIRDGQPEVVGL
jgi:hypothetical protein